MTHTSHTSPVSCMLLHSALRRAAAVRACPTCGGIKLASWAAQQRAQPSNPSEQKTVRAEKKTQGRHCTRTVEFQPAVPCIGRGSSDLQRGARENMGGGERHVLAVDTFTRTHVRKILTNTRYVRRSRQRECRLFRARMHWCYPRRSRPASTVLVGYLWGFPAVYVPGVPAVASSRPREAAGVPPPRASARRRSALVLAKIKRPIAERSVVLLAKRCNVGAPIRKLIRTKIHTSAPVFDVLINFIGPFYPHVVASLDLSLSLHARASHEPMRVNFPMGFDPHMRFLVSTAPPRSTPSSNARPFLHQLTRWIQAAGDTESSREASRITNMTHTALYFRR